MAKQYFTQVDAPAREDWLMDLYNVARANRFVLDMGNQLTTIEDFNALTATLRILSAVLCDCVETGHRRYIP